MTVRDDLSILRNRPFSEAVQKLEGLLAQGGRAFLLGAGCSKCAGLPLTAELTKEAIESASLDETSRAILAAVVKRFEGAKDAHIEDYLSELVDLLAIAERRLARGASLQQVEIDGAPRSAAQLRVATEQIKTAIAAAVSKPVTIDVHRALVAAMRRLVRDGRPAAHTAVDYLVLNYDMVVEDALALERVPYADGLDGGVTGWWNLDTFRRDGLEARVYKLHGSVNWCEVDGDPLPRRVAEALLARDIKERRVLIWPASTKYRETQLDPFAQLADQARRVLRPPRGSQRVLVISGYSFGDAHINIEIDRGLRESAGDLTVIAFCSDDRPTGKLKEWNETAVIREQVLIFARHGYYHGDIAEPSDHELPWWKFENLVRLLEGER